MKKKYIYLIKGANVSEYKVEVEEAGACGVVRFALVRQVRVGVLNPRVRLLKKHVKILAIRELVIVQIAQIQNAFRLL